MLIFFSNKIRIGDMKLPIIRKVIQVGTSKAVTIPKSWFEYFKKETGVEINEVAIEVDRILKIIPILPKGDDKNGAK